MYVDDVRVGKIYEQYVGEYRVENYTGVGDVHGAYTSVKEAIKHAFGSKKDWNFKKKIK